MAATCNACGAVPCPQDVSPLEGVRNRHEATSHRDIDWWGKSITEVVALIEEIREEESKDQFVVTRLSRAGTSHSQSKLQGSGVIHCS